MEVSGNSADREESGEDMDIEDDMVLNHSNLFKRTAMASKVYMWEFAQNDPKRDSGSRLCKLGFARVLKPKKPFNGIVLSSETNHLISPKDREILENSGISGINCSWNRLEEIPFGLLGKPRYHRRLPLLFAANTVNYGKPFKMNTAEAIAASLYICGFKEESKLLLEPFSYGQEFIRLNYELLEAYSNAQSEKEIEEISASYLNAKEQSRQEKEERNLKVQHGDIVQFDLYNMMPSRDSEDENDM